MRRRLMLALYIAPVVTALLAAASFARSSRSGHAIVWLGIAGLLAGYLVWHRDEWLYATGGAD